MISSLYTGASGVQTQSNAMTVTGSNIANVNTTGYKHNRVNFQDLIATTMAGGSKLGKGTKIAKVQNIQTQGAFQVTELETDLAIDGDGFFTIKDSEGKTYYTRAGQFKFDKDGYLTTQEGFFLQTKQVNPETKETTGEAERLKIVGEIDAPKLTGDGTGLLEDGITPDGVIVKANINSNAKVLTEPVNYENVKADTFNFSTSITVHDNKGNKRPIQIAFRKLADKEDDPNPAVPGQTIPGTGWRNRWEWFVLVPGESLEGGLPGTQVATGGGFIEFTDDGRLTNQIPGAIESPPLPAGTPPGTPPNPPEMVAQPVVEGLPPQVTINFQGSGLDQVIGFDFGTPIDPNNPAEENSGLNGITQFASESKVHKISADGKETGVLESIYVKTNGDIQGNFDSGEVKNMGRVVLTNFIAPEELLIKGENLYEETSDSGAPIQGDPTKGGLGSVHSKTLENSNVELSTEFVKMIEGQRAFQAAAKTVTTSDEILADLVQMKR